MPHPTRFRDRLASPPSRCLVGVNLVALEKRYRPMKHYVYIMDMSWSDDSTQTIYRKYSEFFEFHVTLMELFPDESGKYDTNSRIIPFLPGKKVFRSEARTLAAKRKTTLAEYCTTLVSLDGRISQHHHVIQFFESRASDLAPPRDARRKPEKYGIFKALALLPGNRKKSADAGTTNSMDMEEADELTISGPITLQTYKAIADYKALDKGEVSFKEDEIVDIVEKNDNGWWFVQVEDRQGWAPASYLIPENDDKETDEPQPLHNYEQHLVIENYSADMEDELTIKKGAIVNVMHKLLDGWWIVHYNGKVGYAPATYLAPYTSRVPGFVPPTDMQPTSSDRTSSQTSQSEVTSSQTILSQPSTRDGSVKKPAQRRCTIKSKKLSDKGLSESRRDLVTYRKMSVKMDQRQQRPLKNRPMIPVPSDTLRSDDDATYVQPEEMEREYEKNKVKPENKTSRNIGASLALPVPVPTVQSRTEDTLDYEGMDNDDGEDEVNDYTSLSDGDEGNGHTRQSRDVSDDEDSQEYVNIVPPRSRVQTAREYYFRSAPFD